MLFEEGEHGKRVAATAAAECEEDEVLLGDVGAGAAVDQDGVGAGDGGCLACEFMPSGLGMTVVTQCVQLLFSVLIKIKSAKKENVNKKVWGIDPD